MASMLGMQHTGDNYEKENESHYADTSFVGDGGTVCIRTDFLHAAGYQNEPGYG